LLDHLTVADVTNVPATAARRRTGFPRQSAPGNRDVDVCLLGAYAA
jgi:hypothetical protein